MASASATDLMQLGDSGSLRVAKSWLCCSALLCCGPCLQIYGGPFSTGVTKVKHRTFADSLLTLIRRARMLRAFPSLRAVATRCALQNPQLVDTSWLECARRLSPGRNACTATQLRARAGANKLPVRRMACLRCPHSQREFLQSCGQTACACARKALSILSLPRKLAIAALPE